MVLNRKALAQTGAPARTRVNPHAVVEVHGADLSARDNVALGMAANHIMAVLTQLRDRALIDDAELLRVVYRFFGEVGDISQLLESGRAAGSGASPGGRGALPKGSVDLETGEMKGI